MADVSLLRIAQSLQANAVSGMAKKVGLPWPPPPAISIWNLACLALDAEASPPLTLDKEWRNWGIVDGPNPGYAFTPKYFRPRGPHEVARAIRQAEKDGKTVRAFGSGWSFSDVALPQSSPVTIKYPDDDPQYYEELSNDAWAFAQTVPHVNTDGTGINPIWGQAMADAENAPSQAAKARKADTVFLPHFGYGIDTTSIAASLQPLLPQLTRDGMDTTSLFFVEAGIKLQDLNDMLDKQTPPVALNTLGGSHGQSLAGAISTGTHGGDFDRPPIADNVRAIYLIGAQGTHHWIEPTKHVTDPNKIVRTFPCILAENIHYDDDMFQAVLVSMGCMGVIYAVVLKVVQQYSLLQWNKWSTWEELKQHTGKELFDGSWTGMAEFLKGSFPSEKFGQLRNRFVQVVVNPIINVNVFPPDNNKTHNCFVSNRVELPSSVPQSGVTPEDLSSVSGDITKAIEADPNFGITSGIAFEFRNIPGYTTTEQAISLINFCQSNGYYWAIRAVINLFLQRSFPVSATAPQINKGHIVMTGGGALGSSYPIFGITSIEPALEFQDAISLIDALLEMFDAERQQGRYPGGYISLRVTGKTQARLGMQQFKLTGAVEVSLLGAPSAFELMKKVEAIALDHKAILHWGQSNGLMTAKELSSRFPDTPEFPGRLGKWRAVQASLGGKTFTNLFMKRVGLATDS